MVLDRDTIERKFGKGVKAPINIENGADLECWRHHLRKSEFFTRLAL